MTTQTKTKPRLFDRAQRMKDIFLVSSFALWAVALGLSPVFAIRSLMGS